MQRVSWLVLGVVPLACLGYVAAQEVPNGPPVKFTEPPVKSNRLAARRTAVVEVVERVKAAVVNIHSERTVAGPSAEFGTPAPSRINGMGTGIIIDPRGYIVTNHHVVDDVNVLRIKLSDGTATHATVVARSPETDLALLKIDVGRLLPTMPLGCSGDLMLGEPVIAIGNAYGYEHTVSSGIISAIKRDVTLNKELSYKQLIQTNATINPGNSGGPLLNINGELVGVNVAIRAGAQGIAFAIPVDQMVAVVADLLKSRRRHSTFDGMTYRDVVQPGSDGLVRSVMVERVEAGSPADVAGLARGDVLVQLGGVRIDCGYDVERALLDRAAGDKVVVLARRHNAEQRSELVLAGRDAGRPGSTDLIWRKLGVRFATVSGEAVTRANRQLHGGLEITALSGEGAAARAGLKRGDILVGLHQWETLTPDNVAYVLGHQDLATFLPLSFHIVRSGQVRRGWLQQLD